MIHKGFSLLELLIVVTVLSVLTAIAYPSYLNYTMRIHRTDGKTALHAAATQLERYFTKHNSYKDATLEQLGIKPTSEHGFYQLVLQVEPNGTTYKLEAVPVGSQTKDSECGTLSLDQKGKKNLTGTGKVQDCW